MRLPRSSMEASTTNLAHLGYDEYKHVCLWVCSTCFRLFESDRHPLRQQHCRCSRPGDVEQEKWSRYDFNERAILCLCCGLRAVHSGSRFSAFFCGRCQPMCMAVTLWEGRLIFPIGRHSMQHTWVPRACDPGHVPDSAELVYQGMQFISGGRAALEAWYDVVMPENYRELGLTGDVRLRDYLAAVGKVDPQLRDRFAWLCRFERARQAAAPWGRATTRSGERPMADYAGCLRAVSAPSQASGSHRGS